MIPPPILFVFLLFSHLPNTSSQCHNSCSGRGTCTIHAKCACNTGFYGPSCSLAACPKGNAWSDIASPNGVAHIPAECSNKGKCETSTGNCVCQLGYEGAACERMACPKQCSNHGICTSMREAASLFNGYSLNRSVAYTLWDADQIFGCVCDVGFEGADCSQQSCEKGDDPRTEGGVHEKTEFYCKCGATCSGTAILRYKTNALSLSHDATASQFGAALMKLSYARRDSSVYSSGSSPVTVDFDVGTTLCSAAGECKTSSLSSKHNSPTLLFSQVRPPTYLLIGNQGRCQQWI